VRVFGIMLACLKNSASRTEAHRQSQVAAKSTFVSQKRTKQSAAVFLMSAGSKKPHCGIDKAL